MKNTTDLDLSKKNLRPTYSDEGYVTQHILFIVFNLIF